MENIDIEYLATNLGSLCGIPVRIYKNNERIFYYSLVSFPKDPLLLVLDEILPRNEQIGYYTTKDFFYYSFINYQDCKLIIGPTRLIKADDALLNQLAFDLNLSKDDYQPFINAMHSLISMPLESLLQSLCMLNYILNDEKKSVKDILINDEQALQLNNQVQNEVSNQQIENDNVNYEHNTLEIENTICNLIEHGRVNELKAWAKNAPPVRPGVMSSDALRQLKNTFIVTATVECRAAIRGRMNSNDALSLSDLYIQKVELLQSDTEIYHLMMNMGIDYAERVAKIKGRDNASLLLINLNNYVMHHLSDAIKVKDICDALYVSKSVLFEKVKAETGKTVSEYILSLKINEAKNCLKFTDRSLTTISLYLGFSSQSHFQKTFKKFTGVTPIEYKNKRLLRN